MHTSTAFLALITLLFALSDATAQRYRSADQLTLGGAISQVNSRQIIQTPTSNRNYFALLDTMPGVSIQGSFNTQSYSSRIDDEGEKRDFGNGQTIRSTRFDLLGTYRLAALDRFGLRVRPGFTAGFGFSRESNSYDLSASDTTFGGFEDQSDSGLGNIYLGANLTVVEPIDDLLLYGNVTLGLDVAGDEKNITDEQNFLDFSLSGDYHLPQVTLKVDLGYAFQMKNDKYTNGNLCTLGLGGARDFAAGPGSLTVGANLVHMVRGNASFDGNKSEDSNGSITSLGIDLLYNLDNHHFGITGASGEVGHQSGQFRVRARQWEGISGSLRLYYQYDLGLD